MDWRERITRDPKVMVGKPVVRGTRITVELLMELLAAGDSIETILDNYPRLTREDVLAALSYASDAVHTGERVEVS